MPDLSVIIPTCNRPALARRVIETLLAQELDATFELIVVDSASTDSTPQMLAELAARHGNLKTLRAEKRGAAAARNLGLQAAQAPLLLLLDDDILVPDGFLKSVLAASKAQPGCVLLGKIVAPWGDSTDPFQRFLLQSKDVNAYDFADPKNVPAGHFYTACVAIPRAVLGETRFDENFTVYGLEDFDFGMRLLKSSTRMVFVPELEVRHEYFPERREYRRKKLRTGYSLAYFIQKSPENAQAFYVEPAGRRWFYRIYRWLAAPLAGLAYLYERARNRTGPVNAILYNWYFRDLRVQIYNGMRQFRSGSP